VASLDSWTPNDASLVQYKVYTFNASATDPNIGGSITQFQWDMGDGTKTTTPVVLAGGKATSSFAYAYVAAGTPTLSVTAKDAAGLLSPAITKALTVTASPSPLTVAFTSPTTATIINPSIGGSVSITFSVSVLNTGTGTISASGVLLDPGDPTATVLTPTNAGGGIWNIVATYPAAAVTGSRTATPTIKVSDSNGISSDLVTGPAISIRSVSAIDNPPVIILTATPKILAGANSTYQNVPIDFKAVATDPDGDTLTYTWTFGDTGGLGDVTATQDAAALNQTHAYAKAGVYPVTFTANDGRGAVGIKSITLNLNILANGAPTITVAQAPAAPIYASVPITFTATVTDPDGDVPTLSWDFGDGSTVATGAGPMVHSFAAAGSTTVKVTADDGKGGVTSWTNTLNVLLNRPPVSQVTTPVASLFQNKAYTFTATATDPDTGDTITQYQWDFGDGTAVQNSPTATTSHTYASTFTGNAKVAVRAVDNHGSTGDFSPVVVFPVLATSLPVSSFLNPAAAATYNTEVAATGVTIAYIVSATNPNGTGFLPLSALTFSTGETAATATILSSVANGDGTYTYQVQYKPTAAVGTRNVTPSLLATDLQGITGLLKSGGPVTINTQASNNPPVITFTSASTPSAGTNASWQGVAFTFSGTATDADNDPMTYTVTFGDTGAAGDISTTPVASNGAITATHSYAAAGVYTAKLTVSDGRTNGTKTITLNMNVQANLPPNVTVANAPAGTSQYANVPVTFTAAVADPDAGDVPTLSWDFGDGSALVVGQNPVIHSFAAAGSTTVKATANDGKGGVFTRNVPLTILPNLPPVSSLTTPTASLFQNKAYTFTATATDPNGDTISQYQWDFGDATAIQTTVAATTTHSYASSFTGNASVRVRATDNHGSTGDWSPAVVFPVVATPLPAVSFLTPSATTLNLDLSPASVTQTFTFSATNPRAGTVPLTIHFDTNDALGTAGAVSYSAGTYSVTVTYTGAAAAGTRTSTPSAYATDSLGIVGLPANGPLMTLKTLGTNHAPSIVITSPSTPTASAFTSKSVTLAFTLTDQDDDPVSYTVAWGDGTSSDTGTTTTSTMAGVPITLTHVYADTYPSGPSPAPNATVSVNATDNRSASSNAVLQSRIFVVAFNALPTATITSPQASGNAPPSLPVGINAPYVVIPLNGKLHFAGTSTKPGSGDAVTSNWSIPGGIPSTFSGDTPGDVTFAGTPGKITPITVTYTVQDPSQIAGRNAVATKQVLVDGINTQTFNLNFIYRQIKDDTGVQIPALVSLASHGLGATIQIFQDGVNNSYAVQDAQGVNATLSVPVRSDQPFWIDIPAYDNTADARSYFLRIPNAPLGTSDDPDLLNGDPLPTWAFPYLKLITSKVSPRNPNGDTTDVNAVVSMFGFQYPTASTGPWNPTLNIVTAQGFATETTLATQRKLQGTVAPSLYGDNVANRWLARPSVPLGDPTSPITWIQGTVSIAGNFSGIPAYQTFAEWPMVLKTAVTASFPSLAGDSTKLGFNLDYGTYIGNTQQSDSYKVSNLQAFRAPGGSTDPFDLDAAVWSTTSVNLLPLPVDSSVPTFFNAAIYGNVDTKPTQAFTGGLQHLAIPYQANDVYRQVVPVHYQGFQNIRGVFAYSEYLWSKVWAWPLVLNAAQPNYQTLGAYGGFRYTSATTWPKKTGVIPRNSSFDMTATGSGVFDASFPAAENGGQASPTGVGRFFWTAFSPTYNAAPGAIIARTWLASGATSGGNFQFQPPTTLGGTQSSGDALAAMGFVPPQDTMVDKQGRNADGSLNGNTLGGYRVTWFNPTQDGFGTVVPPDFWVVELIANGNTQHFMVPGSFPALTDLADPSSGYPGYVVGTTPPNPDAIPILTDARVQMTSSQVYYDAVAARYFVKDPNHTNGTYFGTQPTGTVNPVTTVAPGYCWFDVPQELRPLAGSSATLRVFALKAIKANNPGGLLKIRALNRTEWIEAIKTATANISVKASDGTDLKDVYKIPFNYAWDIVITNGPATPVAP